MNKENYYTKKEAVNFLALEEKTFENYFRYAEELRPAKRKGGRGRFLFDKADLAGWLKGYKRRTIELTAEDYALCLDFALAQHFRGYVPADWGTARQREFGQKITNWIKGQLAEVAVKKFFKKEFNFDVELDFRIYNQIVPQDIIGVVENGKKREPKIGVSIKASKPKSAYLVLGENEILRLERKSDVYILCRPDIPDDHLLRITREQIIKAVENQPHFLSYKDQIPFFENIHCEIAGWCLPKELEKVKSIPGQKFEKGWRWVKKSGLLRRSKEEWENLIKRL